MQGHVNTIFFWVNIPSHMISQNPQTDSNTHLLTLDCRVSSTRWYPEATSYTHYPPIPQKIKIWAIIPFWAVATAQSHSLHNSSWLSNCGYGWLKFRLGAVGSWFLAEPWQHYRVECSNLYSNTFLKWQACLKCFRCLKTVLNHYINFGSSGTSCYIPISWNIVVMILTDVLLVYLYFVFSYY